MSADNFTGQFISSTFQRLLQLSDNGSYVTDGTGSVVDLLRATSSHALTASYVPGVTAITPGGSLWSIQFNSASTFQGSNNLKYDNDASVLFVTGTIQLSGSLIATDGITGSLFGTASYADRSFRATELGEDLYNLDVFDVGFGFGGGYTDTITLVNIASNVLSTITIDNVQNAGNAGYATAAGVASSVDTLNQIVIVSGSVDISGSLFLNGVAVGSSGTETDPVYTAEKPTLATTGSNAFKGDQQITGSVYISGSFGLTSYGNITPSNPAPQPGLFYFTNTDFYVSLD